MSSYVFRQGDLPKLDLQIDRGSDFSAWQTQWDSYMSLSGLSDEPAVKQVQAYQEVCCWTERRNFRQQPGESFDDYLISLRELVKTCNFCNDACAQKSRPP